MGINDQYLKAFGGEFGPPIQLESSLSKISHSPIPNPDDVAKIDRLKRAIDAYQKASDAYAELVAAYAGLARETGRQVPKEVRDAFNQIGEEIERARPYPLDLQTPMGTTNLGELARRQENTLLEGIFRDKRK